MTTQFQIEYRINTGDWIKIETVSNIALSASSFISDSSIDLSSPLLTPPTGLSVSEFKAGFVSDDTNPTPVITLAEGKYTEVEFNLEAISGISKNDEIELRITNNGVELSKYTINPLIIMTTGSSNLIPLFLTAAQPTRIIQ